MKINCEIVGDTSGHSVQATGLFWDASGLTLFFGQLEKKVLVRPKVLFMSTLTTIIEAEEQMISGLGLLPSTWRIRLDYE